MWKLTLRLLGLGSKDGRAPSLPNLLSASTMKSAVELPVKRKTSLEKLADIALSQVGVKEVGGNNNGPQIRKYQASTNLKPASWPWCAAFTGWVVQQWLKDPEAIQWLGLKVMTTEQWRPKTAAAFGYISWAKKCPATTKVLTNKSKPQVGDFAVFDFSHIGIVVKVLPDGKFQCVEGNTNGKGARDSASGDGVWLKTRSASLVRNFVRIHPSTVK